MFIFLGSLILLLYFGPSLMRGARAEFAYFLLFFSFKDEEGRRRRSPNNFTPPESKRAPITAKEMELWDACRQGDAFTVKSLLSLRDLNVNAEDPSGWPGLIIASTSNQLAVVKALLSSSLTNPNQPNKYGESPLFCAAHRGHVDIVSCLLDDPRVDVNLPSHAGNFPLFVACYHGQERVVERLLREKRVKVNQIGLFGRSPFFLACRYGRERLVRMFLLHPQINPNLTTHDSCSPFYISCELGHLPIIKLLLSDPRVNLNNPDAEGITPLWRLAEKGDLQIAKWLLSADRPIDLESRSVEGRNPWNGKDPEEIALLRFHFEMAGLLREMKEEERELLKKEKKGMLGERRIERIRKAGGRVKARLRRELGIYGQYAAELFGLIIMVSDGLLKISLQEPLISSPSSSSLTLTPNPEIFPGGDEAMSRELEEREEMRRFFEIAQRLPIEMQMVLSHRTFGFGRDLIPFQDSRKALDALLRSFA